MSVKTAVTLGQNVGLDDHHTGLHSHNVGLLGQDMQTLGAVKTRALAWVTYLEGCTGQLARRSGVR